MRWQQTAGHGGGYQYRLCPASEPLTEACFQAHSLTFANTNHTLRFGNASEDRQVPARVVREGGGIGWMRNPLPYRADSCDYVVPEGEHCAWGRPRCGAPWFAADGACPTKCSKAYPNLPNHSYGADPTDFPDPVPQHPPTKYVIEDEVLVPPTLPPGDYVLGWRWDCEMTSQVWSNCADITLAKKEEFYV